MLVAAIVTLCLSGQPCFTHEGKIERSWCGRSGTLVRPPTIGGNESISVRCTGRIAGK